MRSTPKCDIMFASSGGFVSMKTKIIYISGNEVFDMADIRAAFDEVRSTLGLGKDTVMFGVPVDSDDALATSKAADTNVVTEATTPQEEMPIETQTVTESTIVDDIEESTQKTTKEAPAEKIVEPEVKAEPEIKNIKKSAAKKTRTRTKEKISEPAAEIEQPKNADEEKIIPILSILAAKKETIEDEADNNTVIEPEVVEEIPEESDEEEISEVHEIADINISEEFSPEDAQIDETHSHAIADMITDDAPEAPVEKTLEQLLESMTPLREDVIEDTEDFIDDDNLSIEEAEDAVAEDDTDATLEQLAAEFAENQDKIPAQPKIENHSKIGKLKNILPFKKAKRDDSGLMGDLFGWAGVAANDDDFAIPGFFTNAASKK